MNDGADLQYASEFESTGPSSTSGIEDRERIHRAAGLLRPVFDRHFISGALLGLAFGLLIISLALQQDVDPMRTAYLGLRVGLMLWLASTILSFRVRAKMLEIYDSLGLSRTGRRQPR